MAHHFRLFPFGTCVRMKACIAVAIVSLCVCTGVLVLILLIGANMESFLCLLPLSFCKSLQHRWSIDASIRIIREPYLFTVPFCLLYFESSSRKQGEEMGKLFEKYVLE